MRALLVLEDLWPYIETEATNPVTSATPKELDEWTRAQLKAIAMLNTDARMNLGPLSRTSKLPLKLGRSLRYINQRTGGSCINLPPL